MAIKLNNRLTQFCALFTKKIDPVLCMIHIPRTGGMTLSSTISKNFNRWNIYRPTIKRMTKDLKANHINSISPDIKKTKKFLNIFSHNINFFRAHLPYGVNIFFERKVEYITVIRNPIARFMSQINYFNNHKHYLKRMVGNNLSNLD